MPVSRPLLDALRKSKLDDQLKQAPKKHKRSSGRFELLRNDVAVELADDLQRRKHTEPGTREAQVAQEVEGRHKEGGTRVSAISSILRC